MFMTLGCYAQSYNDWVDSSYVYISKKDWVSAEKALLSAVRKEPANPQNSLLLSNLGTVQRRMGKLDDALKSYNNALMITPRAVTLLKNRAALYSEMNRMEDALKDYDRVLMYDEDEENALYLRGLLRLELGDTAACRIDLERLYKLNPQSTDARIGMATLLKCRHYYDNAIDLYNQVIRAEPENSAYYVGRGEAYYYLKKYNKADEDIAKALKLDPDDPLIYVLRAKVKIARYDKEDAALDLKKAVSLGFDKNEAQNILKAGVEL